MLPLVAFKKWPCVGGLGRARVAPLVCIWHVIWGYVGVSGSERPLRGQLRRPAVFRRHDQRGTLMTPPGLRSPAKAGPSAVAAVQALEQPGYYVWGATGMHEWSMDPMRPYELSDGVTLSSSLIWEATVGGWARLQEMLTAGVLVESVGARLWEFWDRRQGCEDAGPSGTWGFGNWSRSVGRGPAARASAQGCRQDGCVHSTAIRGARSGEAAWRASVPGGARGHGWPATCAPGDARLRRRSGVRI